MWLSSLSTLSWKENDSDPAKRKVIVEAAMQAHAALLDSDPVRLKAALSVAASHGVDCSKVKSRDLPRCERVYLAKRQKVAERLRVLLRDCHPVAHMETARQLERLEAVLGEAEHLDVAGLSLAADFSVRQGRGFLWQLQRQLLATEKLHRQDAARAVAHAIFVAQKQAPYGRVKLSALQEQLFKSGISRHHVDVAIVQVTSGGRGGVPKQSAAVGRDSAPAGR